MLSWSRFIAIAKWRKVSSLVQVARKEKNGDTKGGIDNDHTQITEIVERCVVVVVREF